MNTRFAFAVLALMLTFTLGAMTGRALADEANVEQRIAAFWARVDAMQPNDFLTTTDLGQWALNVIDRDKRARLTVQDFRASTAAMQAALDRAGPGPLPLATVPTAAPVGFNAGAYIGQGDAYNCANFTSQAQAQAVLRADPRDPNALDTDRDGIACESNPSPKDLAPVAR